MYKSESINSILAGHCLSLTIIMCIARI